MSRKPQNNHYHYAEKFADRAAQRRNRAYFSMMPVLFALLVLFAFGCISTTFSVFVTAPDSAVTMKSGLRVAVRNHKVVTEAEEAEEAEAPATLTRSKGELADTGANVERASTGITTVTFYYDVKTGHDNYWDLNNSVTLTASDMSNDYYTTLSLTASTGYYFYVKEDSTYIKGTATADMNKKAQLYKYDSNNNDKLNFDTTTATRYTIIYNSSDKTVIISPTNSTVKLAWSVADGHDNDYNLGTYTTMTSSAENIYTCEITVSSAEKHYCFIQIADTCYYKAAVELPIDTEKRVWYYKDSNYGDSKDKLNFTPSQAAKYKFTWNNAKKTLKYELIPFTTYHVVTMQRDNSSVAYTQTATVNTGTQNATTQTAAAISNYTFDGWYKSSMSGLTDFSALTPHSAASTANIEYNAGGTVYYYYKCYTHNTVTLTYITNGGTTISPQTVGYNAAPTAPSDPTKTDYTFVGWYSDSGLTVPFDFDVAMTANTTIYAKWRMTNLCEPSFDTSVTHHMNIGDTYSNPATHSQASHNSDSIGIAYSSSDTSIAEVNASGVVTAKAAGEVNITATCQATDGSQSWSRYTVVVDAPTISHAAVAATVNDVNAAFNPTFGTPDVQHGTVSYSSSDTSKVTVSGGTYTAVAPGSSTITATYSYSYGGYSASANCTFTVTVAEPSLVFNTASISVEECKTDTSSLYIGTNTPTPTGYSWSLSSSEVVTNDSKVTISGSGTAVSVTAAATNANTSSTVYCTATYAGGYRKTVSATVNVTTSPVFLKVYHGSSTKFIDGKMVYDATTSMYKYDATTLAAGENYTFLVYTGSDNIANGDQSRITDNIERSGDGVELFHFDNFSDDNHAYFTKLGVSCAGKHTFYLNVSTKRIYIEFPHTVTYSANGMTGVTGMPSPLSSVYNYGASISAPESDPSLTGYTFGGWFDSAGGNTQFDFTQTITATKTIYAHWSANSTEITVDANGGTFADGAVTSATATYNAAMPGGLSVPTRAGYTFAGYYDSLNVKYYNYSNNTLSSAHVWDKDVVSETLYARWIPISYTVTLYPNAGTISEAGWTAGVDGSNVTIYTKSFTIETATFSLPEPVRTGYDLTNWNTSDTFDGSAVTQVVNGTHQNLTYYANWDVHYYDITLHYSPTDAGTTTDAVLNPSWASGQSLTVTTATKTISFKRAYTTTNTVTLPVASDFTTQPVVSGTTYYFAGWYDNDEFSGVPVTNFNGQFTANKDYYARWTAPHTVTFKNSIDDTVIAAIPVADGLSVTPPTPTASGYTFDTWSSAAYNNVFDDQTIYARFIPLAPFTSLAVSADPAATGGDGTLESPLVVQYGATLTGTGTISGGNNNGVSESYMNVGVEGVTPPVYYYSIDGGETWASSSSSSRTDTLSTLRTILANAGAQGLGKYELKTKVSYTRVNDSVIVTSEVTSLSIYYYAVNSPITSFSFSPVQRIYSSSANSSYPSSANVTADISVHVPDDDDASAYHAVISQYGDTNVGNTYDFSTIIDKAMNDTEMQSSGSLRTFSNSIATYMNMNGVKYFRLQVDYPTGTTDPGSGNPIYGVDSTFSQIITAVAGTNSSVTSRALYFKNNTGNTLPGRPVVFYYEGDSFRMQNMQLVKTNLYRVCLPANVTNVLFAIANTSMKYQLPTRNENRTLTFNTTYYPARMTTWLDISGGAQCYTYTKAADGTSDMGSDGVTPLEAGEMIGSLGSMVW